MLDTIHVLIWKLRIIEKKYIYLWGGGGGGRERDTDWHIHLYNESGMLTLMNVLVYLNC